MTPTLSPDPLTDLSELVRFPFMVHALWAGAIVAVLAAAVGWFMVVRGQTFAGHTLSVMAFPGAAGATLAGLPGPVGFYAACTMAAVAIARSRRSPDTHGLESAAIATVQAVGLAAGFLFLSLSAQLLGSADTLLFGTFLGVTRVQVITLAAVAVGSLTVLALVGRPLLFASLDPEGARASGVPVRALEVVYTVLLGLAVAAASQITGALLVLALLVGPPATARCLTARPLAGLLLSVAVGLSIVWAAVAAAYFSVYPVGFYVTSLAFVTYLAARLRARP